MNTWFIYSRFMNDGMTSRLMCLSCNSCCNLATLVWRIFCSDLQASNEDPEDVFQPDEDMLEASVLMPRACNPGHAFSSALREWGQCGKSVKSPNMFCGPAL